MKNVLLKALLLLFVVAGVSSCSDDESNGGGVNPPVVNYTGAYVLNQGSFYSQIASSIGFLDYKTETMTDSIFFAQNKVLPGNTLQAAVIYGSHFYAIAYESNVLFVCDQNLKLQKQIQVTSPRALAVSEGNVYISNYDGHVTKFDTLTMTIKGTVSVGPNPEEMAVANGYLYVTNSDGMNYLNNYANGKSVSKINLKTFIAEKTIPVGLNPTKAGVDARGNVYVIAMGDYATVASKIQRIDVQDSVKDVADASIMCVLEDQIYAINSVTDWSTYETVNTYFSINTSSLVKTDSLVDEGVKHPIAIAVDPSSKHVFITSYNDGAWGADYSGAGYMNEYEGGKLKKTYKTGVAPVQLVFK